MVRSNYTEERVLVFFSFLFFLLFFFFFNQRMTSIYVGHLLMKSWPASLVYHEISNILTFLSSVDISFIIRSPWKKKKKKNSLLQNKNLYVVMYGRKWKPTLVSSTQQSPTSSTFSNCCNSSIFSPWSSSPLIRLPCIEGIHPIRTK